MSRESESRVKRLTAGLEEAQKLDDELHKFDQWLVDSETSLRNMQKSGIEVKHLREQVKQHKVSGGGWGGGVGGIYLQELPTISHFRG